MLKLTADGPIDAHLELGPTINLRFPKGNSYSTGLVFGGTYGLGVGVPIGRHHLMLDARYMHHWSSSADDYDRPSAARALMFLGKFGF